MEFNDRDGVRAQGMREPSSTLLWRKNLAPCALWHWKWCSQPGLIHRGCCLRLPGDANIWRVSRLLRTVCFFVLTLHHRHNVGSLRSNIKLALNVSLSTPWIEDLFLLYIVAALAHIFFLLNGEFSVVYTGKHFPPPFLLHLSCLHDYSCVLGLLLSKRMVTQYRGSIPQLLTCKHRGLSS